MPDLVSVDATHALIAMRCPRSITAGAGLGAMQDRPAPPSFAHRVDGRSSRRRDALQWLLAEPAS